MAADVTLLALPNTPENYERALYATHELLFDDDEVWRDEEGEIVAYTHTDHRSEFSRETHDLIDWHEIGPVSYLKAGLWGLGVGDPDIWLPGPTVAVHRYWSTPSIVRSVDITQTMVCMNLPNRSHYRGRDWRDRDHRPRQVKRWLTEHLGWIVWGEHW